MNILGHFKTITKHKILVAKGCFRLGLYYQGIMHDMSKYSPTEFLPGIRYYQGTASPNNVSVWPMGIQKPGCIIREETSIISNIGLITAWIPGKKGLWV